MLDPRQRRDLLRIEQSRDAAAITAAIEAVLADNPDAGLLEIEQMLRAAASTAYVVAGEPFKIVIGFRAWRAALTTAGVTAEQNLAALAGDR